MDSFSIGISGLEAAMRAFDIIGNNVANAATDGYHRQRVELRPAYSGQIGSIFVGGGVEVAGVTRLIDGLLEQEILRQQSLLGQISQEFSTLRTVENAFGEFMEGSGLNAAIDDFFNALQDLSAHPGEVIWQNQIVTVAKTLAGQFRTLGEFLTALKSQIELEAKNTIEHINILTNRIAELNNNIEKQEVGGGQANNLRDQRDQSITELSELVGIETKTRDYGVIDVYVVGTPVVIGASDIELESGLKEEGELGISVAGANNFNINAEGGRLGGLLSLRNELVSDIHDNLNDLATAMIQQINQYHIQGVGSTGSFTELTSWPVTSGNLVDFGSNVTDGKIYIRVTNTSTDAITRNEISVDKSADSLSDIATRISAITGLTASVVSSKLHIQADTNYKFDFLPGVLSTPTTSGLTGGSVPTISISTDIQTYLNTDDGKSNELQMISSTATGGTFTLSLGAETTGPIAYNAGTGAVEIALELFNAIDDVSVTGGPLGTAGSEMVVEFKGTLVATDVDDLLVDNSSMNGGTALAVEARQGHAASYTGAANQIYTCTVVGTGDVGVASNLEIEVKIDTAGAAVVKTVNVGSGYAAGDRLDIGDGLFISIGTGTLNNGEKFTIEALANSDTSGLLAAAGINTFFSGSNASDIAVHSDINTTPGRTAAALSTDMTDNVNALRMAGLKDQAVTSLNSLTPGEFYRQMVTDIGQQLFVKQARKDNIESMVQNLSNQQGEISGVDINDEAARMLAFEQMFKAMGKYLSTIQSMLLTFMEII